MNRIDRLFGILTLLQSKKYVPAEKIAEKFDISIRTVYRDVKALGEQGVPVSFEAGKGYFIVQGYFIPPVSFTTEEANAMVLMESLVQGFADRSIRTHYASALTKIKAVLKHVQKEKVEHLQDNTRLQIPKVFQYDFDHLATLQNAISSMQMLEIVYKNMGKETSTRRIEPIGLVFYALNWHLIAWCHKRGEYRDFRVSRIQNVRNTGLPFSIKNHQTLNDYMKMLPVDY